jgi:hypothetical protein
MPSAVDLVLNNGSAVAKTFTLYSPASGDNSLAVWKLKEGAIASVFPQITALARATGNQSRKSQHKIRIPSSYTDSVTGLTSVGSAFEASIDVTVPDNFPEALKSDASAFVANYVNHALAKAMMRDGLSAT